MILMFGVMRVLFGEREKEVFVLEVYYYMSLSFVLLIVGSGLKMGLEMMMRGVVVL